MIISRRELIVGASALGLAACVTPSPSLASSAVSVPAGDRTLGKELLVNNTFTGWAKGSPRQLKFKTMGETADHWFTKWGDKDSVCTVGKVAGGGIRYDMSAGDGVDAFYVRQTPGDVKWFFGKKFLATVDVEALTPNLAGGFYINERWNQDQRVNGPNTGPHWQLGARQTIQFGWTAESHPEIKYKVQGNDNGLEFAFLAYTSAKGVKSMVVHSISLKQVA